MMKFVPVEDVNPWEMVEYMEGKWTETSYPQSGIWNFDMDHARLYIADVISATKGPHGMVAYKHGLVSGLLIGAMTPVWAESEENTFQTILFAADNGCGVALLKEVENTLPKGTRFVLSIQLPTAEKFERIANRLGYVVLDKVFAKIV